MLTRLLSITFLLITGTILIAQPANDNCENAIELCDGIPVSGTTIGATAEQCFTTNPNGCADDNAGNDLCYVPTATVWYKFTTNANGGKVRVDFTNLSINPDPSMGKKLHAVVIRSENPCEGLNYSYVSDCYNNGIVAFSIDSTDVLLPNTTYFIQVDASAAGPGVTQPARINFDIMISGLAVEVLPVSVGISAANTVLCQYDQVPVDLTLTNCSGSPQFEWFYNGALAADSASFQTSTLSESGYLFLKIRCGTEGCPNIDFSDSIFFDITPLQVNAGPDVLIELGEVANLEGSGLGSPFWTPAATLVDPNSFITTAEPEETTIYFLTATNGGCSITDDMIVSLKSAINIPNGFTPNGDNNNDFWEVEFLEQYQDNQVIIYDRSGQVVYKTVGYNNGTTAWDGTYKGKPVPVSTYFYVIDLRNGSENSVFKGPVTIIR
ncbi:MAG: gliding motility-associated C-terminal domain-containing protein [Crocinitomicaceae bacterium]